MASSKPYCSLLSVRAMGIQSVPELASRKHIEKINQVIGAALSEAGMTLPEMTAVAVTYGPAVHWNWPEASFIAGAVRKVARRLRR